MSITLGARTRAAPLVYRVKYRSPFFHAIQILPEISRCHLMGDLPAIIGSLDFGMCEVDR